MDRQGLRAPDDAFVGRQSDRAGVAEALASAPVVTLVGPPGVGKTRLALEVATHVDGDWHDATAVVQLAHVAVGDLLPAAVAAALGVRDSPGSAPSASATEVLVAAVGDRRLLIVIDNCEHLWAASAVLVAALVDGCPNVRVLATSRVPLGTPGELVWPLAPLACPGQEVTDIDQVATYDAVALFVDRARRAVPGFALSAETTPAVVDVCRRLDGIPLAVELAAARLAVVSPGQLARLLADRFYALLSAGDHHVSSHQTLEAAVEWSWDLLAPSEQVLLRRLSVFSGGATAAAARMVCAGAGISADQVDLGLERLSACSMTAGTVAGDEIRYCLLEPVRRFADDRLVEAGEAADVQERHVAWATALAEETEDLLTGPHQSSAVARLDAEADNLRAALAWLIRQGHGERAMRMAGSLTLWWRARGTLGEGLRWSQAALAAGSDASAEAWAAGLWSAGYLAHWLDDSIAVPCLDEAAAIARAIGDKRTFCRALLALVSTNQLRGRVAESKPALEECLALADETGDDWCLAYALVLAARVQRILGTVDEERRLLEESAAVARRSGDTLGLCLALTQLGDHGARNADPAARATLEEALAVARAGDHAYELTVLLVTLGKLALYDGDGAAAERALDESWALTRRIGYTASTWEVLLARGLLAQSLGDMARARASFEQGVAYLDRLGCKSVDLLIGLSQVAAARGRRGAAATLAEEALRRARANGHGTGVARVQLCRAHQACIAGDIHAAAGAVGEAVFLSRQAGDLRLLVDAVEAAAAVAAARRDDGSAARLLAAASSARRAHAHLHRFPPHSPSFDADLDKVGERLAAAALDESWAAGAALTLDEAAALALEAASAFGGGGPGSQLTHAETSVVLLVAEGLTNAAIAMRLGVSPHTVRTHLSNVFPKLKVSSRAGLAAVVTGVTPQADNTQSQRAVEGPSLWALDSFLEQFCDDDVCLDHVWRARFSTDSEHALCPACGEERPFPMYHRSARAWRCPGCGHYVYPTADTVFERSSSLRRWFHATYLMVATGGRISVKQLQREVGVGYKTAWRMADRIRRHVPALDGDV